MKSLVIMVQGTTSDAGKSVLVAGLCRWFAKKGYSVAPFKPQNMALNSAVTQDGGEIGRAQAVQAEAAGVEPTVDMNPVLLKPTTDKQAQVIVQGKALQNIDAMKYQGRKQSLLPYVIESFQRLQQDYEVIVVEGAGSPAEINLRANDIANMGFAEAVNCPVILISDIDRGGVFAHLVGTLALIEQSEQDRTLGFVINKFRGDIRLLQSGLDWLEEKTRKPVYGVLPYIHGLHIEAEDAIKSENVIADVQLKVVVPVIPRISNHTDFDALRLHPNVELCFVGPDEPHPDADLIILPGSKSVIADWLWLQDQGWKETIFKHLRYGGKLMGICGGYQMLGVEILDPEGIESSYDSADGLGLLPISTHLEVEKTLTQVSGQLFFSSDKWPSAKVTGYEIHAGISVLPANQSNDTNTASEGCTTLIKSDDGKTHGLVSDCGQIIGSYWHGIFDHQEALRALLNWAGFSEAKEFDYVAQREAAFDELAAVLDESMDMDKLLSDMRAFK
ncbi:MAG: cobyric acid synthase [Pseudomonadales bacterium]|nr:cobyric acid synthase [Pseudomonadales bacterium]